MHRQVHRSIRVTVVAVVCFVAAATVGCQSPATGMSGYNVRRLADTETTHVFNAARQTLEGYGFSIRRADIDRGWLVTHPARPHDLETAATRDVFGREADERRVATIRILPDPAGSVVYCKVEIQQPYRDEFRLYADAHRASDTLSDTPIDRDAATTDEQNTVWRTLRRDRDLERSLLDAVLQAVSDDVSIIQSAPGS